MKYIMNVAFGGGRFGPRSRPGWLAGWAWCNSQMARLPHKRSPQALWQRRSRPQKVAGASLRISLIVNTHYARS